MQDILKLVCSKIRDYRESQGLSLSFKAMARPFYGVATKYLQNYLAWFQFLDSKEYENTTANKRICW